ncbi:AsmA family protein [Orrella daihaiensis]|uniref:AsmA family protein n=1 Tax=Orrella daihaiensis TaxID=2782176 RepID=A0ABY4ARY3_9BURK|nr:AsmA family protein [Orrella daihaiensis]UOD50794.1 AsmA family protein [Orrella daihaiensis]
MFKTLTRLAFILIASLLLLLVTGLLLLQTSVANVLVENRLRAWVHPALQVNGEIQFAVLPRFGIDLRDVTIPSQTGSHPALSIGQLRFEVSIAALFKRELILESLYGDGLEVFKSGQSWGSFVDDVWLASALNRDNLLRDWGTTDSNAASRWRLLVKQALFENIAAYATDARERDTPLGTLRQLELKADVHWPRVAGTQASLGFRQLFVNDVEAFGHTPALLEQLGLVSQGAWDVMSMDSNWEFAQAKTDRNPDQVLLLRSLAANGAWGELTAASGSVNLGTGEIAIPMQVLLTNTPKFKSRALEITVRQSRMQFQLTGTISDPGVQWLTRPGANR